MMMIGTYDAADGNQCMYYTEMAKMVTEYLGH